jgi:hypothetical protein
VKIFASKGAPPVSTTPAANLPPTRVNDTGGKIAIGINDTGGKFATGINDTCGKFFHHFHYIHWYQRYQRQIGGKLPPVSTTPAANCHRCKRHWWQTMGTIIKLLTT